MFVKYLGFYLVIKLGEQTQFFQVISIENEQLIYKAYTAGEEYDKAVITKDFLTGIKSLK